MSYNMKKNELMMSKHEVGKEIGEEISRKVRELHNLDLCYIVLLIYDHIQ